MSNFKHGTYYVIYIFNLPYLFKKNLVLQFVFISYVNITIIMYDAILNDIFILNNIFSI